MLQTHTISPKQRKVKYQTKELEIKKDTQTWAKTLTKSPNKSKGTKAEK